MPTGSSSKKLRFYTALLVLIFSLPLFFLNVKDSHDWGGDFAMYLKQASNIVNGIPQSETGYIYNEDYPMLGPPAYTVGFPLMLSPIYRSSKLNIRPYSIFMTIMLILFGVGISLLISKYHLITSLVFPLLILYNPWTLAFKSEIVADIPFAFLLVVLILYFQKDFKKSMIIPGSVLTAFLISVKGIALMALAAIAIFHLWKNLKNKLVLVHILLYTGLSVALFLILNKLIYPLPGSDVYPYLDPNALKDVWNTYVFNSNYYLDVVQAFFNPFNPNYQFLGDFLAPVTVILILFGIVYKMLHDFNVEDMVFIALILTLLIYPYGASGFRFLLPLSPMLLLYIHFGVKSISRSKIAIKNSVLMLIAFLMLCTYQYQVSEINKYKDVIIEGPYKQWSVEAFNYIEEHTPEKARILFCKPRVLALYTNRASTANGKLQTSNEIDNLIKNKKIDHILVNKVISDEAIIAYVKSNSASLEEEIINERFTIYTVGGRR